MGHETRAEHEPKEENMTTHYTNSQGLAVEIAAMAYPHLQSAYAKAVRHENEEIALAEGQGFTYETSVERQAEIDAMAEEISKREAEAS